MEELKKNHFTKLNTNISFINFLSDFVSLQKLNLKLKYCDGNDMLVKL